MTAATKPVLVTGATGFLGKHTLEALQRRGIDTVAACRSPEKLPEGYSGEIRAGDLLDPGYRREVVRDVGAVCHTGTWGAFWGHSREERSQFYEPALDLIEKSIESGVERFILASTVAIGQKPAGGKPVDDFSRGKKTQFWPHLDHLIDLDAYMSANSRRGTKMITMRLGHFVGRGNGLGIVPALIPRLRTMLVPWLAGGHSRLALVAGRDMGEAFARASLAEGLDPYESFNICGAEFPTAREVFGFIAAEAGTPLPLFSVPYWAGYMFGGLMEALHPVLPGKAPFLTRSLVYVSEDWFCTTDRARKRLGYISETDWRDAVRESIKEQRSRGFPWPALGQSPGVPGRVLGTPAE